MLLNPNSTYSRKSSIVYDESGFPVLKFKSYLPNFEKLSVDAIKYMNRYYEADPEKFEVYNKEDRAAQLSLF
ncbi:hypothetical protein [Flavobacterium sp. 1355]|uniref:hypothetical protein n=1 Tax=Flavobacterium sp. 1355 TaxID=2806571 RepID=UPI001AE95277|nr:hypothetical protein [Flavobacterium sp. 1355]MBP1222634.1 hypothetical protein [Flavobacterium sp. 1355]